MRVYRILKTTCATLALLSMLVPTNRVLGDELHFLSPNQARAQAAARSVKLNSPVYLNSPVQSKQKAPDITDVSLDAAGTLNGSFVNRLGLPLPGTPVIARQGQRKIRKTQTDAQGRFKLTGLNGGIWSVTVDRQSSLHRIWAETIAPPAAKSHLLVVKRMTIVRGQSEETGMLAAFDAGTLFSVGAGLTGITLGVIGISEAAEANDDAASLRRELNTLSATVDAIQATLN
jgi:hypothetical protein